VAVTVREKVPLNFGYTVTSEMASTLQHQRYIDATRCKEIAWQELAGRLPGNDTYHEPAWRAWRRASAAEDDARRGLCRALARESRELLDGSDPTTLVAALVGAVRGTMEATPPLVSRGDALDSVPHRNSHLATLPECAGT
jgi:hypothetical protein